MSFAGILTRATERYILIKRTVVAYLGGFAYYYAATVIYEQALADGSTGMYFYTCFAQGSLGYPSCYEIVLLQIPLVRSAVGSYCLETGIEEKYFKVPLRFGAKRSLLCL